MRHFFHSYCCTMYQGRLYFLAVDIHIRRTRDLLLVHRLIGPLRCFLSQLITPAWEMQEKLDNESAICAETTHFLPY